MKWCCICEGLLENRQFSGVSPVCLTCVSRLSFEDRVEYSLSQFPTRKAAWINLMLAIKQQADYDQMAGVWMEEDKEFGGPFAAWLANWGVML